MNNFLDALLIWLQKLADLGPIQNLLDACGDFGGAILTFIKDAIYYIDHGELQAAIDTVTSIFK